MILGDESQFAQLRITYRAYVTSPKANRAEGLCGEAARRSAAQPEAPSQEPMRLRAVMGSCAIRYPLRDVDPHAKDGRKGSRGESPARSRGGPVASGYV